MNEEALHRNANEEIMNINVYYLLMLNAIINILLYYSYIFIKDI